MTSPYETGFDNGNAGRLCFDRPNAHVTLSETEKGMMQAGFEDARIAKGKGSYPVLLHIRGRRAYWLVAPRLYQATLSPERKPELNGAGYPDLGALRRLKGEIA